MFHFRVVAVGAIVAALSHPVLAQVQTPLTLEATLARVRAQHPLVSAAESRVEAARGTRLTARLPLNPTFGYQQENIAFPGGSAPSRLDRETVAMVMLPLEPLYQRRPRSQQASWMVDAANADASTVRQRVALDAARAFYSVASAQISVTAAVEVRDWLDSLLVYTRHRVNEGAAAESDVVRLQLDRDRAEMELTLARTNGIRARGELSAFVAATIDSVTWSDSIDTSFPTSMDEAVRIASARRPDLVAARARVGAARAGRGFETSATVRELSLTLGEKSTMGTRSFIAGVALPLPLFDQNRGERQRASADLRAEEQEATWIERRAVADVQSAFTIAQLLRQQMANLRGGFLARADEARRIAVGAYREGAVPLMVVLDAARAYAEAREAYYRTLFTQQQSVLEFRAALGADDLLRTPMTVQTSESR